MELFNILACEVNGVEIADSIVNIFKFLIGLIKIGVPILLVIWVLGFIIGNYIL